MTAEKRIKKEIPGLPDGPLVFRSMQLTDLDRICELEKQCFAVPWSRESFENDLLGYGPTGLHLVGEYKGEIITYSNTWMIIDEANLGNIAVAPEFRSKGVGEAMLDFILARVVEQGMVHIYLEVRVTNEPAIRLYQKKGFRKIGVRKRYYRDNKEDALIMLLKL